MAVDELGTPLRIDVFNGLGAKVAERFLGLLPRNRGVAVDLDDVLAADALLEGGHAELVYDFRDGGDDKWLAACAVSL